MNLTCQAGLSEPSITRPWGSSTCRIGSRGREEEEIHHRGHREHREDTEISHHTGPLHEARAERRRAGVVRDLSVGSVRSVVILSAMEAALDRQADPLTHAATVSISSANSIGF